MDWNKYISRITVEGKTQRNRNITRLKNQINNKVLDNPSYKSVKLNGVETNLIIDSGTQTYYKEFKSLPGQEINIGDYIDFANSKWIVVTCDYDDEIYRDGKLYQCNYLLKWQNELGEIIERWAVILSASKQNAGIDEGNVITLGSDQLSVMIPLDKESLKLKKSMGKKFFIDYNTADPTAYELTGTGNVPDTYNGHGVTSWIVKECAYTASEDDLKYGVCNYKAIDTPTPPSPFIPDETTDLTAVISGNTDLRNSYRRTYTVTFTNKDGDTINWQEVNYHWNVVSDFDVKQTVNDNKITVSVNDENLIGSSFFIEVIVYETVAGEIQVNIVE